LIFTLTMNPSLDRYLYVDELIPDDSIRVKDTQEYAAGKGIDVSRVIREIGGTSIAICPLGGSNGERIEFMLDNEKVLYAAVRVRHETRMNIIVQTFKNQYRLNLPGKPLNETEYELILDMIRTVLRKGDILVASGSLPHGLKPSSYAEIVRIAKAKGVRVYVDTDGENLQAAVKEKPFGIKPNIHELSRLVGRDVKVEDVPHIASHISKEFGITDVLVTLGKDGAIAFVDGEIYRIKPLKIVAKSGVGAGDSFLAGFIHKRNESVEEALKIASACGASAAMNEGTTLAKRSEVEELVKKVEIEKIK